MFTSHPAERVSTDDLMSLATEGGTTPMQVGAVLMLDARERCDPRLVADAIAHRVSAVPRLRQRLVPVPWGCGRPVWVDDGDFTVTDHFYVVRCPDPGGEPGVLEVAAERLLTRLPRDRPLWAATLVTNVGQGCAALIIVFHHVLADGMGGLAVLASLVDGAAEGQDTLFPRPMPSRPRLAVEAAADRLRSVRGSPAVLRRMGGAASQLRPLFSTPLAHSSLNTATGGRRRLATVHVELNQVRDAAHAHRATVNDVVLSAIATALHGLLLIRGEETDQFVISVPFSARREASVSDLGNQSGVVPLSVSGVGDPVRRLESLAERTRAARQAPPGASTALLSPFFRLLAATGLYRRFIDRQRMIHTFVSNMRGPENRLSFLGCPITRVIPLSGTTGNITVSFAVLSYAGDLTITLICDPDTCPELSELRVMIEDELHLLTSPLMT